MLIGKGVSAGQVSEDRTFAWESVHLVVLNTVLSDDAFARDIGMRYLYVSRLSTDQLFDESTFGHEGAHLHMQNIRTRLFKK
jgi:hypothetical protein